ncbi:MAG TPA: hypothetical protein ENK05_13910 [Gammaproteobacteria bacterium]|nr:hypothetical protein [Gammaproteobacteria bacterium]
MNVRTNLPEDDTNSGAPGIQRIIAILWPSFLTSGIATGLFFTLFDPHELMMLSGHLEISRTAAYSIGFFSFWLLTASTCALTCYFLRPCERVPGHK